MRAYFFYLLLNFAVISPSLAMPQLNSYSLTSEQKKKMAETGPLSESQIEELWTGEILSKVSVKTHEDSQALELWVTGLHPQQCQKALRKISHYESYPQMLSFIKTSQYNDQNQQWLIKLDHALMPFPMHLDFQMERVKTEGVYPFTFKKGFLAGLKGEVHAQEIKKRCQLTLTSKWVGAKSKIPDVIFSTFVQTLAELGLKKLIRATKI